MDKFTLLGLSLLERENLIKFCNKKQIGASTVCTIDNRFDVTIYVSKKTWERLKKEK